MTAPVAPPQPSHLTDPSHPGAPSHPGVPSHPTPRPDRGPLVQRVLLGAGALCVLVAGAVYLAVSWQRIGTAGQTGFALVVTVLAAVAAGVFRRRGLKASAETFAVVATGLLALDLAGAHHLDVGGAARMEWRLWLTVAAGSMLVVSSGLALLDRLVAYRLAAVASLAVLPLTGLSAAARAGWTAPVGVTTVLTMAVGAGLTGLAVLLHRHDVVTAALAAVAATAWWCLAAVTGITAGWSDRPVVDALPAALAWGALAVALLLGAGRALAAGRPGDTGIVVSVLGPLAAVPGVVVVAGAVTAAGTVVTLAVAVVVVGLWAVRWTSRPAGAPLGTAALALVAVLTVAGAGRGAGTDVTAVLVLLLGAAAAGGAVHGRGPLRVTTALTTLTAALVGTGLLAIDRSEPGLWVTTAWTAIAVGLLLAATFVPAARRAVLTAGGLVAGLAGLAGLAAHLVDLRSPALAVALLGLGAAVLVHGAVRSSRTAVLLGAIGLAGAVMDLAVVARIGAIEAYTLPIAAVALLAGVLGRIGRPERSSWAWAAPAVLVAAVPSTVAALTDTGVTRLVLTAALAAAVTVAGMRFRLAAPLLLGAATEAALAVSQLAPYAVGAPRWVTLALAGVLLLTLGVLFERARRGAAAAGHWYARLG